MILLRRPRRGWRPTRAAAASLAGLIAVATVATGATTGGAAPTAAPTGSITVFAASSLTEAFTKLGRDFARQHRGATVTFNFGASSTLATQIQQGAPADVFASADQVNVDKVRQAGLVVGRPAGFAQNLLEIAVAPGNPKHIKGLADTVKSGVTLVLCAAPVPCGQFARAAYQRAGLAVGTVPTGLNAKDTLTKVTLGAADAAVVYVTDVKAAKTSVTGVTIPASQNVRAAYPIAVVRGASNTKLATAFERYVLSRAGQQTLRAFGFLAP